MVVHKHEFEWRPRRGHLHPTGRSGRTVRGLVSQCGGLPGPHRPVRVDSAFVLPELRPSTRLVGECPGGLLAHSGAPLPHVSPAHLGPISPRRVIHRGGLLPCHMVLARYLGVRWLLRPGGHRNGHLADRVRGIALATLRGGRRDGIGRGDDRRRPPLGSSDGPCSGVRWLDLPQGSPSSASSAHETPTASIHGSTVGPRSRLPGAGSADWGSSA